MVGVTGFFFMTEGRWRGLDAARPVRSERPDRHLRRLAPPRRGPARRSVLRSLRWSVRQIQRGVGWFISTHSFPGRRRRSGAFPRAKWLGYRVERTASRRRASAGADRICWCWASAQPSRLRSRRPMRSRPCGPPSAKDALVIVAHDWRSRATIPDCPTFEQYVEAGVHGFEVGNRASRYRSGRARSTSRSRPQVPRKRAAAVFLQRRPRDPGGQPVRHLPGRRPGGRAEG